MATWKKIVVESSTDTIAQNTSGSAATLSATLVDEKGGTGQSSYTRGDIIYASADNVLSKLGIGANNKALVSDGTDISWGDVSTVGDLDDLSDVDLSTNAPADNDFLTFNGTNWVPETYSEAGLVSATGWTSN